MTKDLKTYINCYHLDISRPSLEILTWIWLNFINSVPYLGVSYIWLAFGCLDGSTWQVIAILIKTAMKTGTPIQPPPVTWTKYKNLVVPSQFSHSILWGLYHFLTDFLMKVAVHSNVQSIMSLTCNAWGLQGLWRSLASTSWNPSAWKQICPHCHSLHRNFNAYINTKL